MYVLVYAPYGTASAENKLFATNTMGEATRLMERQVTEYLTKNGCEPDDFWSTQNHAEADLQNPYGPVWHIYDVLSPAMRLLDESISLG